MYGVSYVLPSPLPSKITLTKSLNVNGAYSYLTESTTITLTNTFEKTDEHGSKREGTP